MSSYINTKRIIIYVLSSYLDEMKGDKDGTIEQIHRNAIQVYEVWKKSYVLGKIKSKRDNSQLTDINEQKSNIIKAELNYINSVLDYRLHSSSIQKLSM